MEIKPIFYRENFLRDLVEFIDLGGIQRGYHVTRQNKKAIPYQNLQIRNSL